MRILYDHQVFSWQKYGGISRYFYEIIKRISDKNEIYFYQGFNINKYNFDEIDSYDKYFSFLKYDIPHTNRLYDLVNKIGLKCFSKKNIVDIYHPTYYKNYNLKNGKLIVTVYDMIHELFSKEMRNISTIKDKKYLLKKADGIIAISQNTKNDLMRILDIPDEKIKVIYLANSLKIKVKEKPIIQGKYILYVGTRKVYKNFITLLKAYAASNIKKELCLVCFGGGAFDTEEINIINKFKLENRIIYKSGDDNILANLYKYAELFIYPSKYEGFGIPPLEAMYYGTPVLASEVSSIPEVIGDAGIYFNPDEVEDLKEKLDLVLGNTKIRKMIIEKGFIRERVFSWDKCATETINFYEECLNR